MNDNPVSRLNEFGQSPWLDFLSRDLVRSGELVRLIRRWDLGGVTSNPAIFEKAIAQSGDYDADIRRLASVGADTARIYDSLVLEDVAGAAAAFADVYHATDRQNGYVSVEVSPHLVNDAPGTIAEAERLWATLNRPNVMIKVPGTEAGLTAIEQLIAAGININVTLLFSLPRYGQVIDAFLAGLERAAASGRALKNIASVASFFLSRIDTLVDERLEAVSAENQQVAQVAGQLRGEVAIACARCAYERYRQAVASRRSQDLIRRGARMQRLLWASTGTKNPAYDDIKYVQPLICPETVSTMPRETLEAYEQHGRPASTLTGDPAAAQAVLSQLDALGIDLGDVAERLLAEGITKFVEPFDATYRAIREKSGVDKIQ